MNRSKDFPDSFYRVTVKGLCVRDGKILMVHESEKLSGKWELPGGGLDFGEDIQTGLRREIEEEMGLKIRKISDRPVYVFPAMLKGHRGMDWYYVLVVAYRVEFENLDFVPSDECQEVRFFSKEELKKLPLFDQLVGFRDIFNPNDFKTNF